MAVKDIAETIQNIFGRETTRNAFSRENLEEVLYDLQFSIKESPNSIRNIFGWETLKGTANRYYGYIKKIAKHAVAFVKGALRKENIPYGIAEACGYILAYGIAIPLASKFNDSGWPHLLNAAVTILIKDGLFWLGNTAGYMTGHFVFQHDKPYPKRYLHTLVMSNLYSTGIKAIPQIATLGGLLTNDYLPIYLSFLAAQFIPGVGAMIVRMAKNYRGHLWESKYKELETPPKITQAPPTNTLPS